MQWTDSKTILYTSRYQSNYLELLDSPKPTTKSNPVQSSQSDGKFVAIDVKKISKDQPIEVLHLEVLYPNGVSVRIQPDIKLIRN